MASKFIHIKNDTNQENEDSKRCPWEMFRCNYWSSIVKIKLYKLIISTLCDKDKHVTVCCSACAVEGIHVPSGCSVPCSWLHITTHGSHLYCWWYYIISEIIQNGTVYIKNITNSINNVAIIAFQSSNVILPHLIKKANGNTCVKL